MGSPKQDQNPIPHSVLLDSSPQEGIDLSVPICSLNGQFNESPDFPKGEEE